MRQDSPSKLIKTVSVCGIAVLGLSACGPDTSGGAVENPNADTDWSSVEPADSIVFWSNHPGDSQTVESELASEFTEETGIDVEIVTSGATYEETAQRFQTAQGTGEVGDVVVLSDATWFPNYLNGSLAPVDEILEAAEIDTNGYVDALYEDYLYEESHYGVPYARSTPLFYYNADHYEEAGIEEVPETWEEVATVSEQLMDAEVASTAFSFPPQDGYPAWTMANMVWGYGGAFSEGWDFSALTSPETAEALEFAQEASQSWASVSSSDTADDFASGVSSQIIQSTGSLGGILEVADFEVGTAFLPTGPSGETDVVPTGGAGLMVSSAADPETQLAAAMFIGFMSSADSTARISAATGYVPVHKDADMSEVYAETPQFETAVEQLDRTRVQDFGRVFLPGGDLELSSMLQTILTSDVDVASELEATQEELRALYERDIAAEVEE